MKLGARKRKFIIIGLGIIAVLALLYSMNTSQLGGEGLTETVELKKKTLLKQRETLYLEGVYESRLQLYNNRLQADRARLLPGGNPNVAGAELLKTLTSFADRSGVEIVQRNVLREEKVDNHLSKISARLVTRCELEQLVRFFTDIENYEKFLRIEEVTIQMPRNRRQAARGPNLVISGYIDSTEVSTETGDQDTSL